MARYKFKVRNGIHFDIPTGQVWHEGDVVPADEDLRKKYANKFDLVQDLPTRSNDEEDDDGDDLKRSRRDKKNVKARRGADPLDLEEDVDPDYDPLRDERISTNKAIRESLMEKRRMALLRSKVDEESPERRNQKRAQEGEYAVAREGHPAQRLAKIREQRQAQRDAIEARTLRDMDEDDRPRKAKKGLKSKGSKSGKSPKSRAERNAALLSVDKVSKKKSKKRAHASAE